MNNDIKEFSVDIVNSIPQGEDTDFAICTIQALSDGFNTHELEISSNVLMRDAKTCLGKFVVAKMESQVGINDFTGHTHDEIIIGYIPKNSEVRFVARENGTFFEVDAVISKLYSNGAVDIFRRDGEKSVSCEFTCTYSDDEHKVIESFNIRGITILGSGINPSCTGANAKIVKFSTDKADEFYYNKMNNYNILKEGDGAVCKDKINLEEETKEAETLEATEVEEDKVCDTEEAEKETCADEPCENEGEKCDISDETVEASEVCDDDDDDEDDDEDETLNLSETIESLRAELLEKETTIADLKSQVELLSKFKSEAEEAKKASIISELLSDLKGRISDEEYANIEEQSTTVSLEDVGLWKNSVLANFAKTILLSETEPNEITHMAFGDTEEAEKTLWERL